MFNSILNRRLENVDLNICRIHIRIHFALLKTEITLLPPAMLRVKIVTRSSRTEHPPAKLKHHRVSKYAAIGAPILSLICYVYILMQGYAK